MRMQIAFSWITFCGLLLAAMSQASGQHYQPFGDLEMHHDLQLFAPPIVTEYGDEPVAPNYGWFLDYSRAYINLTRPENVPSHYQGDFTWGNIWDIGYMTEDNHGWMMSILHFNNARRNDMTVVTDIQGNTFSLSNLINAGKFGGVELNKTFRVHVGDHGTFFEPFAGVRFGKFEEDLLVQTLVFDDPVNPTEETATGTRARFENNMIGGQLGLRSLLKCNLAFVGHTAAVSRARPRLTTSASQVPAPPAEANLFLGIHQRHCSQCWHP